MKPFSEIDLATKCGDILMHQEGGSECHHSMVSERSPINGPPVPVKDEPIQNGPYATQKELPISFSGRGEVRNFLFRQIAKSASGYLYEVTMPGGLIHFEVFRRTENLRYNCISYPSSKRFGVISWTCKSLDDAVMKFNSMVEEEELTTRKKRRNSFPPNKNGRGNAHSCKKNYLKLERQTYEIYF